MSEEAMSKYPLTMIDCYKEIDALRSQLSDLFILIGGGPDSDEENAEETLNALRHEVLLHVAKTMKTKGRYP